PEAWLAPETGWSRGAQRLRPRLRILPCAQGAAPALRQHPVRRRAADAGSRPRLPDETEADAARRAVAWPRADDRPLDLRDHPLDQPVKQGHSAVGRAERSDSS